MKCRLFLGDCSFKHTTYLLELKFAKDYLAKKLPVYPAQCNSAPASEKHVHSGNEKMVEIKRQSASCAKVLADLTVISPLLTKKISILHSLICRFSTEIIRFYGYSTYLDFSDSFKITKL